jgi:hypothetical protein
MNNISIFWDGPFTAKEILSNKHLRRILKKKGLGEKKSLEQLRISIDYGLYMAIGRHPVNGPNQLLYIGKTEYSFSSRVGTHEKYWSGDEADEVHYYLGRFASKGKQAEIGVGKDEFSTKWSEAINDAERLFIYYTSPPW